MSTFLPLTRKWPWRTSCRACGREERASEGYPCTNCGTFICLICTFRGVTLCRTCSVFPIEPRRIRLGSEKQTV
jgi:hypothetical protein